jgi:meiotic recombination protein SPO11
MDFDPDGIQIVSTYKHGSITLAHENSALALPSIQWIGVKSSHITQQEESHHQVQGSLKLSARDRNQATKMLEREPFTEKGLEPEWRREIQVMLMLSMKAEIQLLGSKTGGLQDWLGEEGII